MPDAPLRTVSEYNLRQVCLPHYASFQVLGSLRVLSVYIDENNPMGSFEVTEAEQGEAWTLCVKRGDTKMPEPYVSLGLCTDPQGQIIFTLWGHRFG